MQTGPDSPPTNTAWRIIYFLGALAALLAVIFFRRNTGTELMAFGGFGIWDVPTQLPVSAVQWFELFQDNPGLAMALFDFIDVINYILVGVIFLALYGALRSTNRRWVLTAAILALLGVAISVISSQALPMLSLSGQYGAAVTSAQRAALEAVGETRLTIHNPGAEFIGWGYYLSLFLVLLAGLIVSIVMLRSPVFSRVASYTGIIANGLNLLYFPALIFLPAIVWLPPTAAALFRLAWYILIAIGLIRLGRCAGASEQRREVPS